MATIKQILNAALERDGKHTGETLVVANHLSQMRLFGIRKGVELFPTQDDELGVRQKFISSLWKKNQLDLILDRLWDLLLCKGQVLFYLRPTGNSYRIYFFEKDQFKAYYDSNAELREVIIIYSYKTRADYGAEALKWLKLRITADEIRQSESDEKPTFDQDSTYFGNSGTTTKNSLGFIPCTIANNYITAPGHDGLNDFDWLTSQIEAHDEMLTSIRDNVKFFGNPTLVATRSMGELTEAGINSQPLQRPTMSSSAGFYGASTGSTFKQDAFERPGTSLKVRRVIGNVQQDERFGYISPDPVSGDHNRYAAEYRENIHTALGGVDPLSINSGATAFEIKSLFGRTAATAYKKCMHLYDYGLCKIFELAILAEEQLFKQSLASALKIPLVDKKTGEPIPLDQAVPDQLFFELRDTGKLPGGLMGLAPLGDRAIQWRWAGPVFEDSPEDILQKSIVVRNLQELGIQSLEGLKFLFPDKTEKELLNMLAGGYPFRYIQSISGSLQQLLGLVGQLMQTPSPQDPNIPLGAFLDLSPAIQSTIQTLLGEMNYGKQFDPPDPNSAPASDATADAGSSIGSSTPMGTSAPDAAAQYSADALKRGTKLLDPAISSSTAGLFAGGSAATGAVPDGTAAGGDYRSPSGTPEYATELPIPGGTVRYQQQSIPTLSQSGPNPAIGGSVPPDLLSYPSIWEQLFPTFTGAARKRKRSKK